MKAALFPMKKVAAFLGLFIALPFYLFFSKSFVFASPPTNFQRQLIVGSGLDAPTGFAICPDGRIFITQREGAVRIVENGQLLTTPFTTLPSAATGDRGLTGVVCDPNFLTNHYIYFYYTDAIDLHNKLVRFDASQDTAQEGPLILYQTSDQSFSLHIGGTVQFGPDGKIYVSIGDNGYFPNAQDITTPHGKIIRLNRDGTIPTDNPFYNVPGAAQEVWAMGFRNPFRFQFDSVTGNMYEGDVGEASWEEINKIVAGGNYGWPECEGYCNPSNPKYIDPIFAWPHDPTIAGGSAASVGGPVYHGDMFPSQYQGALFFGDYAQGWIKTMALDSNGNNGGVSTFDPNVGSVVDMHVSPTDGSLYYLDIFPGALYQVIYSTGNQAPIANATADKLSGPSPLTVNFSSQGTNDPDGDTLTYFWDFGDGTNSTQQNPTKTYTQNGQYTVQLKVSDGQYTDLAVPLVVRVGVPPTVNILSPLDKSTYKAGDTINYSIDAEDSAGNNLSGNQVSTTIIFHHQTHIHPFVGPLYGSTGSFAIPTTGETSPVTWYEIDVTATDASGLSTTKAINIYPIESNLTFTASTPGLQILLDNLPTTTPYQTAGVVGFQRALQPIVYQELNGAYYTFHNWSDGGAVVHTITTPPQDATYSAQFDNAPAFQAQYYPNSNLSGNPTITREDPAINFNWGDSGSPDPSIPHDTFSTRWTSNVYFAAGTYDFTTTTDDGVRLYIDGNAVIDKWQGQPTTSYTATTDLSEGIHEIKMEYFQSYGGAVAQLNWGLSANQTAVSPTPTPTPTATPTPTPTPNPTNTFLGQYWNIPNTTSAPTIPSTAPNFTRQDPTINFVWNGTDSPDPSITHDHFAARWSQTINFPANDTYQFTLRADDGVRFYVDGNLVVDQWHDEGLSTYTPSVQLTSGNHTIQMDYYNDMGGAVAELDMPYQLANLPTSTITPTPTPSSSYTGAYWNSGTGEKPAMPTTTPDLTRTDQIINFNWGNGSPDPKINTTHYIVKWTKTDTFQAGTYHFSATADDGIRVIVDGNTIIDEWKDEASTTYTTDQTVSAGTHSLEIDYYQDAGGAIAQFNYNLTGATPTPTPTPTSSNILTTPWSLSGNNGDANAYLTVDPNLLQNKTSLNITYNLHGLCALPGDASALIFDQNGWKYVPLSSYGTNCMDGIQTVTIPLSDFKDINSGTTLSTTTPLTGFLHSRFWSPGSFTVDITNISVK